MIWGEVPGMPIVPLGTVLYPELGAVAGGENRSPVGSETPQRPFSVLRVALTARASLTPSLSQRVRHQARRTLPRLGARLQRNME